MPVCFHLCCHIGSVSVHYTIGVGVRCLRHAVNERCRIVKRRREGGGRRREGGGRKEEGGKRGKEGGREEEGRREGRGGGGREGGGRQGKKKERARK